MNRTFRQQVPCTLLFPVVASFFLLACRTEVTIQDSRVAAGSRCVGPRCGLSADSTRNLIQLSTPKNPTSARDIEISWSSSAEAAIYRVEVSRDADCIQPFEGRSTRAQVTSFSDLEEGVWFFCLKQEVGARTIPLSQRSLQVLIDRTAPLIQANEGQAIKSGDTIRIEVEDATEYMCEWSSLQPEVTLEPLDAKAARVVSSAAGLTGLKVTCTDQAGNTSETEWAVEVLGSVETKTESPQAPAPSAPTPAPSPFSVHAGADLALLARGNLQGQAIGAQRVEWSRTSGPGTITFSDPASLTTEVTASVNGTYVLRLTAFAADGRTVSDEVQLTWGPKEKVLNATLTRVGFQVFSYLQGVRTSGNYAFVTREDVGLSVVNVTNPMMSNIAANHNLGNGVTGWAAHLHIVGTIAYIANWDRGLTAVDISNPAAPAVLGSLPLTNAAVVTTEGTTAYVALEDDGTSGGLAIVDISNPRSMRLIRFLDTGGAGAGIAKIGSYIYLTHRDVGTFRGLKVIDVTTPATPRVVRTLNRSSMEEIKVVGNHAYVSAGPDGLEIFDVSRPDNPSRVSLTAVSTSASMKSYLISVDVVDRFAFVTDYDQAKLWVYDVSNPAQPKQVRSFATSQNLPALWVHVAGRYAYLSTENRGLEIIDVFAP